MHSRISTCWVVTDGKAGMESQCVGLAEALGLEATIKQVHMRLPWRVFSPYLRAGLSRAFEETSALAPPWPDILIASGRLSVPASLHVRAQSRRDGRPVFTIQIQDPVISPSRFDLVIAPVHDRLAGENVISTIGALHAITPEKLASDAARLAARVTPFTRPYIGVLIGGSNASYRLAKKEIAELASLLREAAAKMCASLLATPSRRTGEENMRAFRSALGNTPAFVWDGAGENPYFGILGLADVLVVTADSVNMISEACASGKPVFIYEPAGGSPKSTRFRRALAERGLVRKFTVPLEPFGAPPFNEMEAVASAVRERMARL